MRPSVARVILAAVLSAVLPSTSRAVRLDADRTASGPVPFPLVVAGVPHQEPDRGSAPSPGEGVAAIHGPVAVSATVGCPPGYRRLLVRRECSGSLRRYWGLAGLGLLVVATGGGLLVSRSRRPEAFDIEGLVEGPFLVFPPPGADPAGEPTGAAPPMAGVELTRADPLARLRPAATMAQPSAAEDRGQCTPGTVRAGHLGVIEALDGNSAVVPREDDPQSDRVEFLPGRLEVVSGPEPGLEFRFIRSAGAAVHEVTIGRESGPPGRHVRLAAATVSRSHARMRFENQQWLIENLSTTNPVQVNDREVPMGEGPRVLVDGDLIRLGEVVLRYRRTSP